MPKLDKPIVLSNHARIQLAYRGTTEEEITETILQTAWQPAELGRLECKRDFAFNQVWNGKTYRTKQVRPIFAEEKDRIVVIIYVYYFN